MRQKTDPLAGQCYFTGHDSEMVPIPNYSQQEAIFHDLFLQTLYVFQAVPPPIIGNIQLYIQLQVLSTDTAASCYRGRDGTNLSV
jgi:hypothetical protein